MLQEARDEVAEVHGQHNLSVGPGERPQLADVLLGKLQRQRLVTAFGLQRLGELSQ